ncbi:hypothetical protein ACE41H_12585 [Paenibacillus enshidis]|uniref:Uncharacterized protein n=1 Tax=Paenibacillus enshidis TaxID=1458439 RepID=A0ABV5AUB7_9BACL
MEKDRTGIVPGQHWKVGEPGDGRESDVITNIHMETGEADRAGTGEQHARAFFQEESELQTGLRDILPRYVDMKRYTSRETKEKRRAKR